MSQLFQQKFFPLLGLKQVPHSKLHAQVGEFRPNGSGDMTFQSDLVEKF